MCVTDSVLDESAIIRRLCTIGEISQICPALTPSRVFMLVHSLVAAPTITSVGQLNVVCRLISRSRPLFGICSELGTATLWQNQKRCVELGDHLQTCSFIMC